MIIDTMRYREIGQHLWRYGYLAISAGGCVYSWVLVASVWYKQLPRMHPGYSGDLRLGDCLVSVGAIFVFGVSAAILLFQANDLWRSWRSLRRAYSESLKRRWMGLGFLLQLLGIAICWFWSLDPIGVMPYLALSLYPTLLGVASVLLPFRGDPSTEGQPVPPDFPIPIE